MVSDWLAGQAAQRAAFYSAGEGPAGRGAGFGRRPGDRHAAAQDRCRPRHHSSCYSQSKGKGGPKEESDRSSSSGAVVRPAGTHSSDVCPDFRAAERPTGNAAITSREHCGTTSEAKPGANFRYCGELCQDDGEPSEEQTSSPGGQAQPTLVSELDANAPHQVVAEETSPMASDPIARAVMEQSGALMCLVASMQQGGDQLVQRILGYQKISRKRKTSAGFSNEIREFLFCCPAKCCEEAEVCLPTRIFLCFIIWNASEATGHTKSWG